MDPDDNKVKIDWFYLNKIVIDTIQENQFLYVSLEFVATVFFSSFSDPFPLGFSFYFILSSFLHLYPLRVDQIAGVDSCSISTFLKSLRSSCKVENYCLGITSSLMRPESQLQSNQCGGSSFFLDIIWLSSVLCSQDACSYQQILLECCPGWQTTPSDLDFAQPRMHSSLDHLLGLL